MTASQPVPTPQPRTRPVVARHRRVKRGIVAGYLHGLSARHRPAEITVAAPVARA